MKETFKDRFYKRVRKTDSCWIWEGYRNGYNYGVVTIDTIRGLTHRLSWQIENGPIPPGMFVCHKCDNPPCINPDHLFLGTQKDNMRDMVKKGRGNSGHLYGEESPGSKLSEIEVMRIRRSKLGINQLAKKYNVSTTTICDVQKGKIWKHLPFDEDRATINKAYTLSEEDVVEIRESTESSAILARRYGVTARNISDIRYGHTWKNIPGAKEPDELSPFAKKLTDEDVLAIRASEKWSKDLAVEYGVNKSTIDNIRSGRTWKHLPYQLQARAKKRKSKVMERDVLDIRESSESGKALAERYCVSQQTICDIRKGRSWAHI